MVTRIKRTETAPTGTASAQKKADILICIGTTGSGKSTRANTDIKKRKLKRVMVWDAMHEYDDLPVVKMLGELRDLALKGGPFAVRFLPSFDNKIKLQQFDVFCRIALAARRVAVLVEELSQVVDSNGGGPGWTQLTTAGRHRLIILYGTSQRPALIDKTALSQATRLFCGNLELPTDKKVMAEMLGVPVEDINALGPWDYIERHRETKKIHRGNLKNGIPAGGYV